jgi:hypothetical protein
MTDGVQAVRWADIYATTPEVIAKASEAVK